MISNGWGTRRLASAKARDQAQREPPLKPYIDIPGWSPMALEMLRDRPGLLSPDRRGRRAVAVCKRDAEVDNLNRQLYRELTSFHDRAARKTISRAIELHVHLQVNRAIATMPPYRRGDDLS